MDYKPRRGRGNKGEGRITIRDVRADSADIDVRTWRTLLTAAERRGFEAGYREAVSGRRTDPGEEIARAWRYHQRKRSPNGSV